MVIFGYDVRIYFLLFMIYSVCGWLLEVTCKLIQCKKFINRGFLIGPYCLNVLKQEELFVLLDKF